MPFTSQDPDRTVRTPPRQFGLRKVLHQSCCCFGGVKRGVVIHRTDGGLSREVDLLFAAWSGLLGGVFGY